MYVKNPKHFYLLVSLVCSGLNNKLGGASENINAWDSEDSDLYFSIIFRIILRYSILSDLDNESK